MSYNRELIEGLLAALLSVLIVGGGIGLSLAEDEMSALGISSPTEPVPIGFEPASSPIPNPSPPPLATEIALQQEPTATSVTVIQASITVTVLPTSTSCSYPLGWFRITVGAGETLESIAQLYNTTPAELSQGNCLLTQTIRPGSILYVPEPPPTEVSEACGPPSGWVFYTVQPGDTLSGIGAAFGVDVSDLQFANCMGNSTLIRVGQNIFVPNVPTNTPEDSPTPTATRKPRATRTNTPRPTATPTPTPRTVIPPTDTPTNTPQPSPSATPQPSLTFTNTPVPSDTPSPTATHTPTFTLTFTPTFTPTPSSTPTPENSPTPTIEQTLPILTLTPTSTQAEEGWFTYGGDDR